MSGYVIEDVAYSGDIVQVEMGLLDGLSVVSLGVGKTKKTLLEEGTALCQWYAHMETRRNTYSFSFQKAKAMCC
jgi:hypothetical protein